MNSVGDIDIDVANRDPILKLLNHRKASIIKNGKLARHNVGIYVQNIPVYPDTNLSTIDYGVAEDMGYQKVDILNNTIYQNITTDEQLLRYMQEPMWELFCEDEVCSKLSHIGNYCWLIKRFKPSSVNDLAMILALIRPSKKYLQNCDWEVIKSKIWVREDNEKYAFKKSHAISYAVSIVVELNKLCDVDA